jgi:hypothetical protein
MGLVATTLAAYRESIEQKPYSGNEDDDPLERLSVDSLIDLTYTDMAILGVRET